MDREELTARMEAVSASDRGSRSQTAWLKTATRDDEAPILARGEVQTPQGQRKAILLANLALMLDVLNEALLCNNEIWLPSHEENYNLVWDALQEFMGRVKKGGD